MLVDIGIINVLLWYYFDLISQERKTQQRKVGSLKYAHFDFSRLWEL